MHAIGNCESFQVIGINKDGSQQRLCSASSAKNLDRAWAKEVARHRKTGPHNILPTFRAILAWGVRDGFYADAAATGASQ